MFSPDSVGDVQIQVFPKDSIDESYPVLGGRGQRIRLVFPFEVVIPYLAIRTSLA